MTSASPSCRARAQLASSTNDAKKIKICHKSYCGFASLRINHGHRTRRAKRTVSVKGD
jgi:hypothetical protein